MYAILDIDVSGMAASSEQGIDSVLSVTVLGNSNGCHQHENKSVDNVAEVIHPMIWYSAVFSLAGRGRMQRRSVV